jgi:hypothetical protein
MGGYRGINEGLSHRLEPRKRAFLVQTHEPAIASDTRREHAASSAAQRRQRRLARQRRGWAGRLSIIRVGQGDALPAGRATGPLRDPLTGSER